MWSLFTALVWIGGIVFIIERYLLGVKLRINTTTFDLEKKPKTTKPPGRGIYLSNDEEIRRESIRGGRESAIARR